MIMLNWSGQPNSVVLEQLARCDFIIDQLYADFPMPGFATEAAWFGKPAVTAGYALDLWKRTLPKRKCHQRIIVILMRLKKELKS